jgi:hypothetical protein
MKRPMATSSRGVYPAPGENEAQSGTPRQAAGTYGSIVGFGEPGRACVTSLYFANRRQPVGKLLGRLKLSGRL